MYGTNALVHVIIYGNGAVTTNGQCFISDCVGRNCLYSYENKNKY
jgi:hypothetical protein